MRAARVVGSEGRIVPPDFRARPIRMIEKVEIVDRDHLRRSTRRNHQGVKRLNDIQAFSRELLGGWPVQPVPGVVQGFHGYLAIDDGSAWQDIARKSILPGGGEEQDPFVRVRGRFQESASHFVYVFADACSLAKRWPVVEQNPHERNPPDAITEIPASAFAPQLLTNQSVDTFFSSVVR